MTAPTASPINQAGGEGGALGVGLDTGGTFTDIVLFALEQQQVLRKVKTPTTHGDYSVCIAAAFKLLALRLEEVRALVRVVLSTTLATNAVAENNIHSTGLLIEAGDIRVPDGFHPHLVLLRSALDFATNELVPVSAEEVLRKTTPWAHQVESFAVSGYAATRDPRHEQEIAAILHEGFAKPVVMGSQLTHRLNFLERARAATLNAGLLPVILEWLTAVRGILERYGIGAPLYLVKGDGSLMEAADALRMPVQMLHSGPAASLQGGSRLSRLQDAIVIDVGGTTSDVGRVRAGRGLPREGGVRIKGRAVAVDGLNLTTVGLGGDSRLRRVGARSYHFENRRVLPFCRAAQIYPGFTIDRMEAELVDQWHFADLDLLEWLALVPETQATAPNEWDALGCLDETAREVLVTLSEGPMRIRVLQQRFPGPGFQRVLAELALRRRVVSIAFTPTDLFCAEGRLPLFSQADARAVLGLYARMLDTTSAEFATVLWETIGQQTTALLIGFLAELRPDAPAEAAVLERLASLAAPAAVGDSADKAGQMHLDLIPDSPLVLTGASAPLLFARVAPALQPWIVIPEHGDVANAVGAIASQFVLRASATVEPLQHGGVELFDHQGKRVLPSLKAGLSAARSTLENRLQARGRALGLAQAEITFHEEIIEEYAGFARRARRELVLARVEAVLTGLPG